MLQKCSVPARTRKVFEKYLPHLPHLPRSFICYVPSPVNSSAASIAILNWKFLISSAVRSTAR